jgi:hypothetical protein
LINRQKKRLKLKRYIARDALPLLKVTETLHWEKPLTYNSAWVGLLLLGFKVTVIVPVIAAFAWYWAYLERR